MNKFAHIIHPVVVSKDSDLNIAQPLTYKTIQLAKSFASDEVDVSLFATKYIDENPQIPKIFQQIRDLDKSIIDVKSFKYKRKLALIKDILDRLYESTDAEYLIYTNVDICLMPHFYLAINHLINLGYDAIIINRRTISNKHTKIIDIPTMYSELGKRHKGHDCFVFKKNVYKKYLLGETCIGADRIGAVVAVNMFFNANQFKEFKNLHLTFHVGNDKIWKTKKFDDYCRHNENQLKNVILKYDVLNKNYTDKIMIDIKNRYSNQSLVTKATRKSKRIFDYLNECKNIYKDRKF